MRIRFSFSFELPKFIERFCVWAVAAYHCGVLGQDIRVIPLTRFKFAIVDAEDFERLNKFRWAAYRGENLWYATRHKVLKADGSNRGTIWMHRELVKAPKNRVVDHYNQNGLDNRKENLRIATKAQNAYNCKKKSGRYSSEFKGVSKSENRWQGRIFFNGRQIHLGSFGTEIEAAKAYDRAAIKHHGKFARLNFPQNYQSTSK